jgi:homoserine kinase type II
VSGGDDIRQEALTEAAVRVWACYPQAALGGRLVPLGNGGGFSGARLWLGDGPAGRAALRAWPPHKTAAGIRRLHSLMEAARQHGLDVVPAVHRTREGDSVVEAAGRVWELTQWLPGRADFAEHPTAERLDAACTTLARLHRAWEAFAAPAGPCPAVGRRLKILADWSALVSTGWRPQASATAACPALGPAVERAWNALPGLLPEVPGRLLPWLASRLPMQPCLCDLWHDHLLFEGDRLTGLIDYGALKIDHVAVDLARMLGSLVGDDPHGWERGLQSYRRIRPLSDSEAQLARVLDRTGIVLGVVTWLRMLYHEKRAYEDHMAVARRLETLLNRIDGWTAGAHG